MSVLNRTRNAIYNEFHDWIPGETKKEKMAVIREATYSGSKDPGQWSPDAAVVIHTESGIPRSASSAESRKLLTSYKLWPVL